MTKYQNATVLALLGLMLFFYTWMLIVYSVPVTGGTDQNGYHLQARMLEKNGVFYRKISDPQEFVGHMWVVNGRSEYYPKYPPIYPAFLAGLNRFWGEGGSFFGSAFCAILAAAGMFALARFFLNGYYALLASLFLMLSPVFSALGISKNSHTPSLALLIWGITALLYAPRMRKIPRFFLAMLSGILVGAGTGVRYTDFLLLGIPLCFSLFLVRKRQRPGVVSGLFLGFCIPLGFLAAFHWIAYGSPFRTGYSLTDESGAFSIAFVWDNLRIYLPELLTSVIGPVALFALLFHRFDWRRGCFWGIWLIPTFVLYLTYYWAPTNAGTGAMRFLMPLLPPLLILSLQGIRFLQRHLPRRGMILLLSCVIIVQCVWGFTGVTRLCEQRVPGELRNAVMVENCRKLIPEHAIVIGSPNLLNELDYELKWQLFPNYLYQYRELSKVIERSLGAQAAGLQKARALHLQQTMGALKIPALQKFWIERFDQWRKSGRDIYMIGRSWEVNTFRRMFYRQFEMSKPVLLTGVRPDYLILPPKRDASRYRDRFRPQELPVLEVVRLGNKRTKVLPLNESELLLQQERRELFARLNPDQSGEIRRDLERLEIVRDDLGNLNRARVAAEKAKKERAERLKKQQQKKPDGKR